MSLQLAAQHLASQGRGNDSMLIHVSPRELKSLNDLAQVKGGSLSVNPNTGLPEAGFLEDLLPVAAAVALDYFAPGAGQAVGGALGLSSAAGTAAIVGGTTALLSGSVGKGLAAGLGAYGGSSLFSALGDVGAAAAMPATGGGTAEQAIMQQEAARAAQATRSPFTNAWEGLGESIKDPSKLANAAGGWGALGKSAAMAAAPLLMYGMPAPKKQGQQPAAVDDKDMGQRYAYTRKALPTPAPDPYGREQVYYTGDTYTPISNTQARSMYGYADGGMINGLPEYAEPSVVRMAAGGTAPDVQYKYDPVTQDFILVSSVDPNADTAESSGIGSGRQDNTFGGESFGDSPRGGSPGESATVAAQKAAFAAMTPGEQAAQQAMAIPNLVNLALPLPAKMLMSVLGIAPPGSTSSGGVSATSGSPMSGIASKGNVGQVANAVTTAQNAIGNAIGAGAVGGTSAPGPSGMSGMGTGAHGAAVSAGISGGGVGSGGVGSGGVGNGSGASSAGGSSAGSAYSDVRMKDNIKPIDHALNKVRQLDGITYDMGGKRSAGLSAQQVERVLPEVVHKDSKGMRKLDYGNTIGLLVEAVKELDSKNNGKAGGGMLSGYASGGLSDAHYNLGGYSDGGRLLRGPGDGVSDSIPAVIGKKQPARLADGEFVVPARIVSELGNGSTEAGARKLYAMMDRIQKARGKTVGKGKVAKNSRAEKYLPA